MGFGNFWTKKFTDIYPNVDAFMEDFENVGIPAKITEESASALYYLLYARYGNSCISNFDENQFKYKLFSKIFMYGPAWEKRLEIQEKLRNMTEDELMNSKVIHNHAFNPGTVPSTSSLEELIAINEQNTSNYRKNKLDAYANLIDLIETDVTGRFIESFKDLFIFVTYPQKKLLYEGDE